VNPCSRVARSGRTGRSVVDPGRERRRRRIWRTVAAAGPAPLADHPTHLFRLPVQILDGALHFLHAPLEVRSNPELAGRVHTAESAAGSAAEAARAHRTRTPFRAGTAARAAPFASAFAATFGTTLGSRSRCRPGTFNLGKAVLETSHHLAQSAHLLPNLGRFFLLRRIHAPVPARFARRRDRPGRARGRWRRFVIRPTRRQ
jgi:hypothetical protein